MEATGQENSIYDYYERISSRFFLAREKDGKRMHIWEPMAKAIQVPGFKNFDFFIIQSGRQYHLAEGLSGAVIISLQNMRLAKYKRWTREKFIKALPLELWHIGGRGAVNQAIVNFIFDNDQHIAPRYKAKKV